MSSYTHRICKTCNQNKYIIGNEKNCYSCNKTEMFNKAQENNLIEHFYKLNMDNNKQDTKQDLTLSRQKKRKNDELTDDNKRVKFNELKNVYQLIAENKKLKKKNQRLKILVKYLSDNKNVINYELS